MLLNIQNVLSRYVRQNLVNWVISEFAILDNIYSMLVLKTTILFTFCLTMKVITK